MNIELGKEDRIPVTAFLLVVALMIELLIVNATYGLVFLGASLGGLVLRYGW